MQSEHLTNLHPGWVVGGWLIAIAVTSGVYLAVIGLGLLPEGPEAVLGIAVAVAAGFFTGGLFVGARWNDAPILHGAAITFLSVLVWLVGSVALPGPFETLASQTPAILGLILIQLAASAAGGWAGRWMALRSGSGSPLER